MHTVIELERAGVAALTIEDTLLPAKYGHKSTDLIPLDEAVGKIDAALEARIDRAMIIFARTNAAQLSVEATYDCLREQRGIAEGTFSASELSSKYSTLEENRAWASRFMDVHD